MLRRRDALARELAELQFDLGGLAYEVAVRDLGGLAYEMAVRDLGGLAYEMAVRDHWRIDVLVRRAAKLQELEAQLAGTERLARLDGGAVGGACPACGALHARAAAFCSHCGAVLMVTSTST